MLARQALYQRSIAPVLFLLLILNLPQLSGLALGPVAQAVLELRSSSASQVDGLTGHNHRAYYN